MIDPGDTTVKIRNKSNLRGLRDIRTRSGRVERMGVPYMAYMKISCLEMEKARREKERSSAEARIRNINQRLGEIEGEKGCILVHLGERQSDSAPNPGKVVDDASEAGCTGGRGFKIRY